jgi:integrase
VWTGIHAVLAAAGFGDVRPYALRHSYGSAAVDQGASLARLRVAMGHADSRVTEHKYLHYEDDFTTEVADVLDAGLANLAR